VEAPYEGVVLERTVDGGPLNADAAAVDEPNLRQSQRMCFVEIFLDD